MLRKGIALAALSLGLAPVFTSAAKADDMMVRENQPWELILGAGGNNGPDFNGLNASANLGIGYYVNETLELSIRQSLQYTDLNGGGDGSAWNGSTRAAVDLHFPLGDHGQFVPFIGANIGYVYGETVSDTWEGAPEVGIKYYVNSSTFIYGLAEYQFFFDQDADASDSFSDGQFIYSVGIGFRF